MARSPNDNKTRVWPGSGSVGLGIPTGWHTSGQVARLIGRSKDTVIRWRKDGTYSPSGYMLAGQITVWLYSDDDAKAMTVIASQKKAGRRRKEEE